jgi:hypothetical protein
MTPKRLAGPARATGPSVSVVIAAYSSDRWAQLRDGVASVGAQHRPALETIVVIDHNPELLGRAERELTDAVVVPNAGGAARPAHGIPAYPGPGARSSPSSTTTRTRSRSGWRP